MTIAAVVVLAAAGLTTGLLLSSSSGLQYQTEPATIGTVSQTVSLTGTIEPVSQADLNFGASGTVSAVSVQVGQKVSEGTVLATLETSSLVAQVDQAQAAYGSAEIALETAETPTGSLVSQDEMAVTNDERTMSSAENSLSETNDSNEESLIQSQQALQTAQTNMSNAAAQMEDDQAALTAAEAKESSDCNGDAQAASVCTQDQSTVSSDQALVKTDQSADANAQNSVQTDEENVVSTEQKNAQGLSQAEVSVMSAQSALTTARANLQMASDGSYQNELTSDEAMVASAQSNLQAAERSLTDAKLIAPISGTVTEVNLVPDASVSAGTSTVGSPSSSSSSTGGSGSGSSTPDVELVSPGTFEIQATASDTQLPGLKVGQRVEFTASGDTTAGLGTVTQVGTIPTVSSGVATFPITIGVKGTTAGLYEGISADVSVTTLSVANVLTVPSSAVHTIGSSSYVDVLSNGKEVTTAVTIGAVGSTLTQIKSGLTPGEEVVLAEVTSTVPTTSTGGFGGFGGGGFGGGGGGGFSRTVIGGGGLG